MQSWHSKWLGHGAKVFWSLKALSDMQKTLHPDAASGYIIAIDAVTAETLAFFPPDYTDLALAYGAHPCGTPDMHSGQLKAVTLLH